MIFKKKNPKKFIAKLRDGAKTGALLTTIKKPIDSVLLDDDNDPTLEDYEAVGGNVKNLKGEALFTFLDLETDRQRRQMQNNNTEIQETTNRISEILYTHGFLASLKVDDPKTERECSFFRIILECRSKEEELKAKVVDYIDFHSVKAKHQYDTMKEVEQWFLDLLDDKTMEREFNDELFQMRFRHEEQLTSQKNVEGTLANVAITVQKLRNLGYILILSSSEGVSVFEGQPAEGDDTVTLLVPTESGNDVRFSFTVILNDEAMFRDPKVQLLAQQYLKGMIFYGSAAKHKNRAQKRKVIRLMMRQLEAIYNFITRLRNALLTAEKEGIEYKIRVDELQMQKDQAYRDRERYKSHVDDVEVILKKVMDEREVLRLANAHIEELALEAEHDRLNSAENRTIKRRTRLGKDGASSTDSNDGVDSKTSTSGVEVTSRKKIQMVTLDQEVQVSGFNKTEQITYKASTQDSLKKMANVEIQPILNGFTIEERSEFEKAKKQIATFEDTVAQLTGELEDLKSSNQALEKQFKVFGYPAEQTETRRAIEDNTLEKAHQAPAKTEVEKQFLNRIQSLEEEVESKIATIYDLEKLMTSQNLILCTNDHLSRKVRVVMEEDGHRIFMQTQTDEVTPADVKVEMQKLKSSLAEFHRSIIAVLVAENPKAGIPSFAEQLRDTWSVNSTAMEIAQDVKGHFGLLVETIASAFSKVHANNRKSIQVISAKKASQMDSRVQGANCSEEMRQVQLKLHQHMLELEADNSNIHETVKTLTKVLEENRTDYEEQLAHKDEKVFGQCDENHRMKDLAWSLAESLAKLRDEAVTNMPERKSLTDIMQLLQVVEQRLGKNLRNSKGGRKLSPQLLVQGVSLADPTGNRFKLARDSSTFENAQIPNRVIEPSISRDWTPADRETPIMWDKRSSLVEGLQDTAKAQKGTSTSDRLNRSALEYTRFYVDPVDGWTVRSSTQEIIQTDKMTQTFGMMVESSFPSGQTKNINAQKPDKPLCLAENGRTVGSGEKFADKDLAVDESSEEEVEEIFDELMNSVGIYELEEVINRDGTLLQSEIRKRKHGRHSNQNLRSRTSLQHGLEDSEILDDDAWAQHESLRRRCPHEGPSGRSKHEESFDCREYENEELRDGPHHKYGQIGSFPSGTVLMHMDFTDHHSSATSHFLPLDPNYQLIDVPTSADQSRKEHLTQSPHVEAPNNFQPNQKMLRSADLSGDDELQGWFIPVSSLPSSHCLFSVPCIAFGTANIHKRPKSKGGEYSGRLQSLGPHEQKEFARRESEKADAILTEMENSAVQEVHKLRRSHKSSFLPLISNTSQITEGTILLSDSPENTRRMAAEVRVVESDANQTEVFYLEQLEKLRRARMHISEVKNRLAVLETDVEQHTYQEGIEDPISSRMRRARGSRSQDPSEDQINQDADALTNDRQVTYMTKEGMKILRKEARTIKRDIKVLQRGYKEMVCRNTRSPENREDLCAAQEQRTTGFFALYRCNQTERKKRISESKTSCRKKMEGFDQVSSKFFQHGQSWKKLVDGSDERTGGGPVFGEVEHPSGKIRKHCSSRPGTARPGSTRLERRNATVVSLEKRDQYLSVDLKATGVGLNSPNDSLGKPEPRVFERKKPNAINSKISSKRNKLLIAELIDGSITRKLKYLRDQRLSLAPRYTENKLANPLIRTHRGEEPLEGPVDLAPFNFSELGIIGRPIPPKMRKKSNQEFDPKQSLPLKEGVVLER